MTATAADRAPSTSSEPAARWVALTAASGAVVAWSWGPIFVREIGASTPTIVFWRMWFALPVMLTAARLTGGRIDLALLRRAVVPGILFAASMITSFASYQATSIANATLIAALQPALIMLVAPKLFDDRVTPRQIGYSIVAFGGMVVVVFGAGSSSGASLHGDLFAFANMLIWTAYFVRVKRVRDDGVHAWAFLACVFVVAAVVITPWSLLSSHDLGSLHPRGYVFVVLMCFGPGLLGHGSMTWAQRHLDITLAALVTLAQPGLSTLWAWWLYGERLVTVQVIGALVVLVALIGVVQQSRGERAEAPTALSVAVD